jgi:hypothetical protein
MNAMENYKTLVDLIFERSIDIPNSNNRNNCTGALVNSDNYSIFRNNFIERLKRIYCYFKADTVAIDNIINTVKSIALAKGYKWSGPYSELVCLDYWIQFKNIQNMKYVHRGNVNDFPDSIAKDIGQTEIDLDLSLDLSFCKIYMDVKSLIPTHLELVDQILDKLEKRVGTKDYLIGIDDLFEVDYLRTKKDYIYELQSGTLIEKLAECISKKENYYEHTLVSGEKAKFRIAYSGNGTNTVLMTQRSMYPYRLAQDYKYKVLDYYNKLLKTKPSFITLVTNPWFNKEMNDFDGFNEEFYRALSRRAFIELSRMTDDMGDLYPELKGKGLKICDVSKLITGIIFIEDHSIQKNDKEIYKTYIYTNPNAENKKLTKYDFDILHWSLNTIQPSMIDDFNYDNY